MSVISPDTLASSHNSDFLLKSSISLLYVSFSLANLTFNASAWVLISSSNWRKPLIKSSTGIEEDASKLNTWKSFSEIILENSPDLARVFKYFINSS